jgi:predicted nucleic acid-binding protein
VSNFTVLFDACVLYPAPLRDLLMRLAATDLFRAKWTEQIHQEWIESLLKNRPDLNREKLERTKELMNQHAGDCIVTDYESLINAIELPDVNDRHVLAAAIKANAAVIVTFNSKDFPEVALKPYAIELQDPDTFITHLLDLNPGAVCAAVKRQRANLTKNPKTIKEFLEMLEILRLPQTVSLLRSFAELL